MPFPSNILPVSADGTTINAEAIVSNASNIIGGDNPPYTVADFLSIYPGFGPEDTPAVPTAVMQMYISLATASIKQARYQDAWIVCMGLFVAHFLTLWLQGTAAAGSPAAKVIAAGAARGLKTSKSVGDVSVSLDYNTVAQGLTGWAAWNLTIYGQQFATMAKLMGKGGMVVW